MDVAKGDPDSYENLRAQYKASIERRDYERAKEVCLRILSDFRCLGYATHNALKGLAVAAHGLKETGLVVESARLMLALYAFRSAAACVDGSNFDRECWAYYYWPEDVAIERIGLIEEQDTWARVLLLALKYKKWRTDQTDRVRDALVRYYESQGNKEGALAAIEFYNAPVPPAFGCGFPPRP